MFRYELNSTKKKETKYAKKSFHLNAQLLSLQTLFAKGSNPRRRGGGGAGCPALDRASLHLTSEKKRGTKGGGAVGRGTEGAKKLARLQYIFIEGAAWTGGGGRERGEGNLNASTAAT